MREVKPWVMGLFLLLAVSMLLGNSVANFPSFLPDTGDTSFDATLKELNTHALGDISGFVGTMSETFSVPVPKVEEMVRDMKIPPGDVFMILNAAKITKEPFDFVLRKYQGRKDKGWGALAMDLGIKPGSPEFHALKNGSLTHLDRLKINVSGKNDRNDDKGKGTDNGKGKDRDKDKDKDKDQDDDGKGHGHGKDK